MASLSLRNYPTFYQKSIKCPDEFWGELAHRRLQWRQPFKQVMQCNMEKGDIKWFLQGKMNVSGEQYALQSTQTHHFYNIYSPNQCISETIIHTENCLDRHAEEDPNRVALIWEKDEPNQQEKVTYRYIKTLLS